jgi:type II secretory pathway pseudopilin PulG
MFFVSRSKTLKGPVDCLNNQQGAALIIVLIVMAVLTLVGLSAINTATVENKIVGNERIYQENFYLAESSVNEAAQKIENETDSDNLLPSLSAWIWMHDSGNPVDFTDPGNWVHSASSSDNAEQAAVNTQALYSTVYKGVAEGSSLDIGAPSRLYKYAVFGHGKSNNGSVIIEIGYRKRF